MKGPIQGPRMRQPLTRRPFKPKRRTSILNKFGVKKQDKIPLKEVHKTPQKPEVKAEVTKEKTEEYIELKQPKQDVFKKLSSIVGKPKHSAEITKMKSRAKKTSDKLESVEQKLVSLTQPGKVYSTKSGNKYHKKDCITLKGKKVNTHGEQKKAKKKNLKACKVCHTK